MAKKKTETAVASTAILIATVQIKGAGVTLDVGEELTAEKLAEMGFDKKTDELDGPAELERLKDRGFIKTTTVRSAEPVVAPEAAELKAALARADEAEAKVAALQKQVDDLTGKLAAATKA